MESVFCTQSTLRSPWGISMPAIDHCMMFHLLASGTAHIQALNTQSEPLNIDMQAGDFILLPKGIGHVLSDGESNNHVPLNKLPIKFINEHFEQLEFGGNGRQAIMLCGAITFKHPLTLKLLETLPNAIYIQKDDSANQSIQSLVHLLSNEAINTDIGTSGMITRLADLLVITALRQYLEHQQGTHPNTLNWVGALADARITKAVQLVHKFPEKHWSLEELATQVGMSRTNFAVEFKRLVGNSPMDYLTAWRMSLAYTNFQTTKDSILTIATQYGYQSESAFSRAFKKVIGFSPGEVRKRT